MVCVGNIGFYIIRLRVFCVGKSAVDVIENDEPAFICGERQPAETFPYRLIYIDGGTLQHLYAFRRQLSTWQPR